jgi:protein-disulfide isomerase
LISRVTLTEAIVILITTLQVAAVSAQTPACDSLDGSKRKLAQQILASEYLYDCSDTTIAQGLDGQPRCNLAWRLAENVCQRIAAGQEESRVRRALSRRARSMLGGGEQVVIDGTDAPVAGDPEAPVEVVVYACARCPYCSRIIPALYHEITKGSLVGQARLMFRTFPIRGHEGSTEGGLAFVAAAEMDSFWEYALLAYNHFDEFEPSLLEPWAAEIGLEADLFAEHLKSPETRASLVASKKEGLANGVEETPTFFISNRLWVGELELEELVDAIGEEAQRIKGELCSDQ